MFTVVPGNPDSPKPRVCPLAFRQKKLHELCQSYSQKTYRESISGKEKINFGGSIFNKEKKVFICRINKGGIISIIDFLGELNTSPRYNNVVPVLAYNKVGELELRVPLNFMNRSFDQSKVEYDQYNIVRRFPLDMAIHMFAGYRKLIIARHPLQRLVSGYFQRKSFLHRNLTLAEFLRHWISHRLQQDPHWEDFQSSCYPCLMDYNYVFKLDNINEQIHIINPELGASLDKRFPETHTNPEYETNTLYKYDPILRKLEKDHPKLFQNVLDSLSFDMQMFGYEWKNHESICNYPDGNCC